MPVRLQITAKILAEAALLKGNVLRGWQLQNGNAEKIIGLSLSKDLGEKT
jgi:hypothetical protein